MGYARALAMLKLMLCCMLSQSPAMLDAYHYKIKTHDSELRGQEEAATTE